MLDHTILTVSDVERALAFYEAALKPLNVRFFLPYKGEHGHPDLWGGALEMEAEHVSGSSKERPIQLPSIGASRPKPTHRSMTSIRQRWRLEQRTISRHGRESNTIQDITQPMYSIPTDTHSKWFIKVDLYHHFPEIADLVTRNFGAISETPDNDIRK